MVRITCPKCGAGTEDTPRKFCPACCAGPLSAENHGPDRNLAGIPVEILAVAGIILFIVAAVILFLNLIPALSGPAQAGLAGTGLVYPATSSPDRTPLHEATTQPVSGTPAATLVTLAAPLVPVTSATGTPVPATTGIIATCQTYAVAKTTPLPKETPEPKVTSQITLAETWIPEQPPTSSYSSATPGAPVIDHSALEARIHDLINVQRRQNGISELSYDSFLADIARGHSYDMVLRNYFDHTDPDGKNARARGDSAGYPCIRGYRNYYTAGIGENLYQGYRYNSYLADPNGTIVDYKWNSPEQIADQAVTGWMNSEGHRKNILDDHFQQKGIGIAFSADDKIYVTENFC